MLFRSKEVKRPRYRIHTSDYFRENPSLSTKEKKATIKEQRKCDKLIVDFISVHEGCSVWAMAEAWSHYADRIGAPTWFGSNVAVGWAFALCRSEDSKIKKWLGTHWTGDDDRNTEEYVSPKMFYFGTKEFWNDDIPAQQ